jgi:hypothetical protein
MKMNRKHYSDNQLGKITHDSGPAFIRVKMTDKQKAAKRVEDAEFNIDNWIMVSTVTFVVGFLGLIGCLLA